MCRASGCPYARGIQSLLVSKTEDWECLESKAEWEPRVLSAGVQSCPMSQQCLVGGAVCSDGAPGSGHTAQVPTDLSLLWAISLLPWFLRVPGLMFSVGWLWNAADPGLDAALSMRITDQLWQSSTVGGLKMAVLTTARHTFISIHSEQSTRAQTSKDSSCALRRAGPGFPNGIHSLL